MIETTDPMVAVVYGAACHQSQANGLAAAFDLVAGGTGPWPMSDDDRARWAIGQVSRLHPSAGTDDLPGSMHMLRRQLGALPSTLPGHLTHQVTRIDDLLAAFVASYPTMTALLAVLTQDPPAAAVPAPSPPPTPATAPSAPADTVLPSLAEAVEYRRDQWMALMRRRYVSIPVCLAALKQDAEEAGLVPPGSLADVQGNVAYTELLLSVIEAAS